MNNEHDFHSVTCMHCGNQIAVPVYCRNRFCQVCGSTRLFRIRTKLIGFVNQHRYEYGASYKHLTLSIANYPDLCDQVNHLVKSFRRLRHLRLWQRYVYGGAYVVEIKRNKTGWHAHLHIIISAKYIPWEELREAWTAVSGGLGCYLKKIPRRKIVYYLTKYMTKIELSDADQRAATEALSGKRLFQPFGSWYDQINKIPTPVCKCPVCEHWNWEFGSVSQAVDRLFEDAIGPGTPYFPQRSPP